MREMTGMDKKKILVAEDDRVIAKLIRFNLQKAGFDVRVCADGRQGVELLDSERFDLIIADYQMPEMNGEELCRQARQNTDNAGVPIFLVTAKALELESIRLQLELSITEIISKPFSTKQLLASVFATLEPEGDASIPEHWSELLPS